MKDRKRKQLFTQLVKVSAPLRDIDTLVLQLNSPTVGTNPRQIIIDQTVAPDIFNNDLSIIPHLCLGLFPLRFIAILHTFLALLRKC